MKMIIFALLSLLACNEKEAEEEALYLDAEVVDALSMTRLKSHVDVLADDATGGRIPGSSGHAAARDYIAGELADIGLEPFGDDGYLHTYPTEQEDGVFQLLDDGSVAPAVYDSGTNLVGVLPGSDPALADQHIVVLAHYDHLGVTEDGEIYNGAFDDVSGVAALLEIARVLVSEQVQTGRSIIFLITDEEEMGLEGAEAWLADQVVPYGDIAFGLSVDPVGRGVLPDYWPLVLMGLERSPALLEAWRGFAEQYAEMDVIFVHRDIIPVFASDQDEFYRVSDPIPAAWFTSPGMAFYHTTDDTPETIDYRSLRDQTRFLLQALAFFGDDETEYAYEGAPDIGPEHAADVIPLIEGILASEYPDTSEREEAQGYLDELTAVVEADDIGALSTSQDAFFYGAIYFLVFVLPAEHTGEIPPPFPDE